MIGALKTELQELLGNTGLSWISFLFQLFIIVFFLWFCYKSFVKNSPAEKTVKGMLFFVVFTWLLSEFFMLFHLRILAGLLRNFILLLILSAVIIFQPELRRLMSLLGNQVTFFTKAKRKQLSDSLVNILIQSIAYWRKYRTGALIVFERMEPINIVCTGGISLDAKISTELLINLFFVNTPLHDGAVICSQNRIAKAGVILPLSKDATLSWKYGTRHRAAIGLSETTDALCLVVSEETGDVSLIQDGKVQTFYEMNELEKALPEFLSSLIQKSPPKTFWQKLKSLTDK